MLVGKSYSVVPGLTTDPKLSCLKLVLVVSELKQLSKTVKDVRFWSPCMLTSLSATVPLDARR